ncbi:GTP-dependent dephospho-CoA kinase family protein [Haladaptatus sp. DYSN1]|uniref:GTP-dependent dephospho-CoA kinase family protein n=1 Tax=unclassified Haladaptatus TaxID=2622732 RepID=UPI002404A1B6|nr:GTP-dependent dephospho-CoA kinase family protein [Haladaptatus sp. DYSN1]
MTDDAVLTLPDDLRSAFKDPLGPLFTDPDELLQQAGRPIIAVGDIVTYHLTQAGVVPDVAVIDGKTKRKAVDEAISEAIGGYDRRLTSVNPAATLTEELLSVLREAIDAPETVVIVVEGEEDLATLPAIVAAPEGASVVYGQPDAGMVLVTVTPEVRHRMFSLLEAMAGDHEAAWTALGVDAE